MFVVAIFYLFLLKNNFGEIILYFHCTSIRAKKNCQQYNKKLYSIGHFPLSMLVMGDFYCWHCCFSTYPLVGLAGSIILAAYRS